MTPSSSCVPHASRSSPTACWRAACRGARSACRLSSRAARTRENPLGATMRRAAPERSEGRECASVGTQEGAIGEGELPWTARGAIPRVSIGEMPLVVAIEWLLHHEDDHTRRVRARESVVTQAIITRPACSRGRVNLPSGLLSPWCNAPAHPPMCSGATC